MNGEDLLVRFEDGILELVLNRPEKLNAFSEPMMQRLTTELIHARVDDAVKVVVISGAGRAFSAGGDIASMDGAQPTEVYEHIGLLNRAVLAMTALPKPVIASVQGFAAGAGFNLALASDLIVAADDAKFVMSFAQVGLTSDGGGHYFLPYLVGPHVAKELLFLAEPLPASRAYAYGIVNRLVPPAELAAETTKLARRLAMGPSVALGQMKRLVDRAFQSSLAQMLEDEQTAQVLLTGSVDHREGVTAFGEKRQAKFQGR